MAFLKKMDHAAYQKALKGKTRPNIGLKRCTAKPGATPAFGVSTLEIGATEDGGECTFSKLEMGIQRGERVPPLASFLSPLGLRSSPP